MALGKKIRNFDLRGRFIPRSKNEMEREREWCCEGAGEKERLKGERRKVM